MEYLLAALCGCILLLLIVVLVLLLRRPASSSRELARLEEELEQLRQEMAAQLGRTRQENSQAALSAARSTGELLAQGQSQAAAQQDKRLAQLTAQLTDRQDLLQRTVQDQLAQNDQRLRSFVIQTELKLDGIRTTVENRLAALQEDNGRRLEQMRATVDEKLQKTLDDRISQSFRLVSDRLEQVYKGLGEMQTLAAGVGDLKRVLSNVKTRGILGEIQLGAILEEILSPEQYDTNVVTRPGSGNPVEYAVRLPGDGEQVVYLPIDAKFPADAYSQLLDAYDSGSGEAVAAAGKVLDQRIRQEAKDIRDKYLEPPYTTDFGILFLPVEGLYAEAVRRGLVEVLQREYRVSLAGPTTMAALLNSLQMGFRTLAIQKRSGEVWQVLAAVKTEFDKFGAALARTQQRLEQAGSELDNLVGVRTRQIQRRLRSVSTLPEETAAALLSDPGDQE